MIIKYGFISVILTITLVACSSPDKSRAEQKKLSGSMEVAKAWARPAAKGANTAVYLSIYNGTAERDTLFKVQSEITDQSRVHETYTTEEGLSGMRPAERLVIASGDSLILKPGGLHVMLNNIKRDLFHGDSLLITIQFSKSSNNHVLIPVRN